MNNNSPYIPDDGYTLDAYLLPWEPVYGEIRLSYRPMLVEERAAFLDGTRGLQSPIVVRKGAHELAKRIMKWSILDNEGNPLPIEPKKILRLVDHCYQRLFSIVISGNEPGDLDPRWREDQKDEFVDDKYESALADRPVAAVREERDAKNLLSASGS